MSAIVRTGQDVFGQPMDRWLESVFYQRHQERHGLRIQPLDAVADAPPVVARVDAARWIAGCPNCGTHENVWLDQPLLWCCGCGNRDLGGRWRAVQLPSDAAVAQAEALLRSVPEYERHWDPSRETLEQLDQRLQDVRTRYQIGAW